MNIIVTGGAGFIGSNLIKYILKTTRNNVCNIDKLTYAGNLKNLEDISNNERYLFNEIDICDPAEVKRIFDDFKPAAIMHLAAESHVDRSIDCPDKFIKTNIIGTFNLLNISLNYWQNLKNDKKKDFRFHHISTDEVYGSLGKEGLFREDTSYSPNSPYSASKASSDHLVRAWFKTYGLPVLITNCSNNYGPYQYPEKLIPLIILNALEEKPLPIYGKGENIRDWLYVYDHVKALYLVLKRGVTGETYNIGGFNEIKNIDIVKTICRTLDKIAPEKKNSVSLYEDLITFVEDRPGHDLRYAIDANKIKNKLSWVPEETFETGIEKTIRWYLNNLDWCKKKQKGKYNRERLGIGK